MTTVAVLHPGAMGAALVAALRAGGSSVVWASQERSQATRARAAAAGATDVGTLAAACARSDVVVSICPPAAASNVAAAVAAAGFRGLYVDANAVSPRRVGEIAALLGGAGVAVVDATLVGAVPQPGSSTRLYLSGPGAGEVARLFAGPAFEPVVIGVDVGRASALKMAHAAITKGRAALDALGLALAEGHGVRDALVEDWRRRGRKVPGEDLARNAARAWRWVGELHEIGDTAAALGLPDELPRAAADLLGRWSHLRDDATVGQDRLLAAMLDPERDDLDPERDDLDPERDDLDPEPDDKETQ